jgi:hypothetical protein
MAAAPPRPAAPAPAIVAASAPLPTSFISVVGGGGSLLVWLLLYQMWPWLSHKLI